MSKQFQDRERCQRFLEANGWQAIPEDDKRENVSRFWKEKYVGIDLCPDEIVLIGDSGDFHHEQVAQHGYYQLIGLLLDYRQIDAGYKSGES